MKAHMALTSKQEEVFEFIRVFIFRKGYSPSFREIGDHFGMSVTGAYDHVKALKRKGAVTYVERTSRTLRIMEV